MDRLIEKIIDILETAVVPSRSIKRVTNGDPYVNISDRDMPAIVVSPVSASTSTVDNMRVEDVFQISLTLVLDRKDYMNANIDENSAQREAVKIFEETEVGSNQKKTDTILGALIQVLDCDTDYVLRLDETVRNYQATGSRETPTIEPTMTISVVSPTYLRVP